MEKIIKNPGLQHLAENVFLNLNYSDLNKCQLINQSTSQILDNPMFWINELIKKGLSKKNQNDWIKAIQSVKSSSEGIAIISYLQWNWKKDIMDVPCYSSSIRAMQYRLDRNVNAKISHDLVHKLPYKCYRFWPLVL